MLRKSTAIDDSTTEETPSPVPPILFHNSTNIQDESMLDPSHLPSTNMFPEAQENVFNEISLDFFDPFLGNMFDQFAFPALDDQTESPEPFQLQASQNDQYSTTHVSAHITGTAFEKQMTCLGLSKHSQQCIPQIMSPPSTQSEPKILFTSDMRDNCLADLQSRLSPEQFGRFQLPDTASLQKCIDSYIKAFHIHFPFLHLATLDLGAAPSPLTLAICTIGALHRLERRLAASLYLTAERALTNSDTDSRLTCPSLLQDWARPRNSPPVANPPLALSQARVILVFYAAFSGNPSVARQALIGCGLSCSTLVLGNLLSMTYGISPGFTALEERNIEMPVEDALWDAPTASSWEALAQGRLCSSPLGLQEATASFFMNTSQRQKADSRWIWSPFAASVVMHSVAISVWYLNQGQQACYGATGNPQEGNRPGAARIEAALSRCRDFLTAAHAENEGNWSDTDNPLLFNAFAVLRVAYGRAFFGVQTLDRSILFHERSQDMLPIIEQYFNQVQERDHFITMAVTRALEGFAIPIRTGMLLMQKTAAFKWSVEHALAAWDAGLLVTKWVHTIEQLQKTGEAVTSEEGQVLNNIRRLLKEIDMDRSQDFLLSAELARIWASLFDDTCCE
ncbi:zinc finger protein [Fusarium tjaetaba]|uniref:Zinc finger protein n=1 Tax=Fusarium tjaetaba TaxID=1567544 RepID=A0A8H5REE0_9HYPO|nr:zinc finger protein [Fusarium tjaetaba]KAF5633161.1 zinc finger protein [Fusarium tjaetaba]